MNTASSPPAVAQALDAHLHLEVLANRVQGCTACGLHKGRKQAVFSRGNHTAPVMFVGEAPGADDDEQGLPFVGRAGQLLDKMIEAMGLGPDEAYLVHVCRCLPPDNRTPTTNEIAACLPYLHEQIVLARPQVIVALGATAAKALCQTTQGIKAMRGNWDVYLYDALAVGVMPTYHPAFVLRETDGGRPGAKRDVWGDLQEVLKAIGRSAPSRGQP